MRIRLGSCLGVGCLAVIVVIFGFIGVVALSRKASRDNVSYPPLKRTRPRRLSENAQAKPAATKDAQAVPFGETAMQTDEEKGASPKEGVSAKTGKASIVEKPISKRRQIRNKVEYWEGTTAGGTVTQTRVLSTRLKSSMGRRKRDIGARCRRYLGDYSFWDVLIDNRRSRESYIFNAAFTPLKVIAEDGTQYTSLDLTGKFIKDSIMHNDQEAKELYEWFKRCEVMPGAKIHRILPVVAPKKKTKIKSVWWVWPTNMELEPRPQSMAHRAHLFRGQ